MRIQMLNIQICNQMHLLTSLVVAGQTGNYRHFLETFFEVWAGEFGFQTKAVSGTKYK